MKTPRELAELRDRLGLSQTALAKALGLSRIAIAKMEAGERPIEHRTILALERLETGAVELPDAWIIGEGIDTGETYLVHLDEPRCIVEVGESLLEGIVYSDGAEDFRVAAWLDPYPGPEVHTALLIEAAAIVRDDTEQADRLNQPGKN